MRGHATNSNVGRCHNHFCYSLLPDAASGVTAAVFITAIGVAEAIVTRPGPLTTP